MLYHYCKCDFALHDYNMLISLIPEVKPHASPRFLAQQLAAPLESGPLTPSTTPRVERAVATVALGLCSRCLAVSVFAANHRGCYHTFIVMIAILMILEVILGIPVKVMTTTVMWFSRMFAQCPGAKPLS